jgi:hypothetical protein
LARVQLRLPNLLAELHPKPSADVFLNKLGSLARLAQAVGHAKKDHLLRLGGLQVQGGFLLERSGLAVDMLGVEQVAEIFLSGADIAARRDYARAIRDRLRSVLADHSPRGSRACLFESQSSMPLDGLIRVSPRVVTESMKLSTTIGSCLGGQANAIKTALHAIFRQNQVSALDIRSGIGP